MKKIILPFLLVGGAFLSLVYVAVSYVFVDESLLLMLGQTKPWIPALIGSIRNSVSLAQANNVALGLLSLLCLAIVVLTILKKDVNKKIFFLAFLIPCLLVFTYPIVSRDIFSYLFYAKTVLTYHMNPYFVAPASFWGTDLWVGFLHNVERVYAYGPVALLINLIPMAVVGAEKLLVNFYLLKITSLIFFLFGAWLFLKLTKNRNYVLALWVLNPFVINELLINGHNDLMMIVFFWLAIYLKQKSKTVLAILAWALSVATKYVTVILLPIFFVPKKWQKIMALAAIVVIGGYFVYNGNLLWYFSWFYFCLPYLKLNKAQVFSILLLQLSLTLIYSGFLEYGLWGVGPNNWVISTIISSNRVFVPLFVLATIYPYFEGKLKLKRFS